MSLNIHRLTYFYADSSLRNKLSTHFDCFMQPRRICSWRGSSIVRINLVLPVCPLVFCPALPGLPTLPIPLILFLGKLKPSLSMSRPGPILYTMALIFHGNLEHVAHAWRNIGLFNPLRTTLFLSYIYIYIFFLGGGT